MTQDPKTGSITTDAAAAYALAEHAVRLAIGERALDVLDDLEDDDLGFDSHEDAIIANEDHSTSSRGVLRVSRNLVVKLGGSGLDSC